MIQARAVIVLLFCAAVATAGEAVSGLNGKIAYSGGSMEGDCGQNGTGSVSLPLGDNFGLQADGLYTNVSDRDFYGAGGHLFWRDWDKGLLGVTGATLQEDEISAGLVAAETECYLSRFTLAAGAGVATIDYDESVPFIDSDPTNFYGSLGLRYYPLDDLMLAGSYVYVFDNSLVLGELEYQTPIHGLTFFAEFAGGENDYEHALFGVQFYLGKSKTLIRRHREDDPPSIVRQALYAVGTYGAEYNKKGRNYADSHDAEYEGGYGLVVENFYSSGSLVVGSGGAVDMVPVGP
ncbi:MAG: hypothetical protein ABFE01_03355 [Phycisphaerales bacterium]|jgi:hypothetical protein